MATVLDLRRIEDPRDSVHRTVEALARGHVVGIPTETVYGLAADALNPAAVKRLVEIKGRSASMPLAIAVRGEQAIEDFVCHWSALSQRLARRCMPGPITLVLPCDDPMSIASRLPMSTREMLLGEHGCIGFRVVAHPVIAQLHDYLRGPLVLTSANLTGQPPATRGQEVFLQFGESVPLVLDDGPTRYGGASTVVRVIGNRYEILRHGAIESAAMTEFAKPMIALVCTGNTCRSPMAEVILKDLLRKAGGGLESVLVISAGVAASDGCMASQQAVDVMESRGLDLNEHQSQALSDAVMERADLILTMTRGHRAAILTAWPDRVNQVRTLRRDGGDIADPVGSSVEVYEQCANQIERELSAWIESLRADFLPVEQISSPVSEHDEIQSDPHSANGDGKSDAQEPH
jgi:tRNA threonylcarbamoyl adenosine modification protein (Sua5/YciO/YrdC/YwlC family)